MTERFRQPPVADEFELGRMYAEGDDGRISRRVRGLLVAKQEFLDLLQRGLTSQHQPTRNGCIQADLDIAQVRIAVVEASDNRLPS